MMRRPPRSTPLYSSAASDVYKRQGSVTNALGYTYELRVIAATVIGGANLMGGVGGTFGAFIGAALMETIRNSLLMAGIDPYWQGTFLGLFIVGAVWLEKVKNKKN